MGDADAETTQFLPKRGVSVSTQRQKDFWSRLAVGSITLNLIIAALSVIYFMKTSLLLVDVDLCTRELSTYCESFPAIIVSHTK
jgi:hypothetical protein